MYTVPLTSASSADSLMLCTLTVPAAVPLVRHTKPSESVKYASAPDAMIREVTPMFGLISTVPAAVPSLFHSPLLVPSVAPQKNVFDVAPVKRGNDCPTG